MAGIPGQPGYALPKGEDDIVRRLRDIERTLTERGALTNPVAFDASADSEAQAAITTTSTARATLTFTVPVGFTQALVTSTAGAMGKNSTATTDYLYVMSVINGTPGGEMYIPVSPGWSGSVSAPYYGKFSGLTPGQTFTVSVATRTNAATWDAASPNLAMIHAQVIYLR